MGFKSANNGLRNSAAQGRLKTHNLLGCWADFSPFVKARVRVLSSLPLFFASFTFLLHYIRGTVLGGKGGVEWCVVLSPIPSLSFLER
jgi:hypothetical protein